MTNFFKFSFVVGVVTILLGYLVIFCRVSPLFTATEMTSLIQDFRVLNKTCLILGASGETGKSLVSQIAEVKPFYRVILVGRRKLEYKDEEMKKFEQRIVDFDNLDNFSKDFEGADVTFCCLGTTRGKAGGDGFIKVDHDYVVDSARLSLAGGCKHFHLVSSQGADESSFLLYSKVKGQVEREVSELGFERTTVYRPAVLMVDRVESRPVEAITRALLKPIACIFPTAITTPVDVLARAMIMTTVTDGPKGTEILDNKRIHALGKEPFAK